MCHRYLAISELGAAYGPRLSCRYYWLGLVLSELVSRYANVGYAPTHYGQLERLVRQPTILCYGSILHCQVGGIDRARIYTRIQVQPNLPVK